MTLTLAELRQFLRLGCKVDTTEYVLLTVVDGPDTMSRIVSREEALGVQRTATETTVVQDVSSLFQTFAEQCGLC